MRIQVLILVVIVTAVCVALALDMQAKGVASGFFVKFKGHKKKVEIMPYDILISDEQVFRCFFVKLVIIFIFNIILITHFYFYHL